MGEWHEYVAQEREKQLCEIIKEENLHPEETHKFIENSFRDGGIKTTGTEIDKIMPSVSRFGGGREKKKRTIIEKLKEKSSKHSLSASSGSGESLEQESTLGDHLQFSFVKMA